MFSVISIAVYLWRLTITIVNIVAGLVIDEKFKKNTVSLHEILPTHVHDNFNI